MPGVLFLQENNGLVLVGGPKGGLLYQKWTTWEADVPIGPRVTRCSAWVLLAFRGLGGGLATKFGLVKSNNNINEMYTKFKVR